MRSHTEIQNACPYQCLHNQHSYHVRALCCDYHLYLKILPLKQKTLSFFRERCYNWNIYLVRDTIKLVPICSWRMGHGRMVSTLDRAVDGGVASQTLGSAARFEAGIERNWVNIGIYPAFNVCSQVSTIQKEYTHTHIYIYIMLSYPS